MTKISKKILKNAEILLESAITLQDNNKLLPAAHMAVLCLEECTKSLMNIEDIKQLFSTEQNFSHVTKNKLIGVFYFIAGGLQVLYHLKHADDEGVLGGTEQSRKIVMKDLLEFTGVADTRALAKAVKKFLNNAIQSDLKYEKIRTNSVYCDLNNGILLIPKKRVSRKEALETIAIANFSVGLLKMIFKRKFEWNKFLEIYPKHFENIQASAHKLVKKAKVKFPDLKGKPPCASSFSPRPPNALGERQKNGIVASG